LIWLATETKGSCCEHGNEPSGNIKGGELLDWSESSSFSKTLPRGVSYLVSKSFSQSVSQSISQSFSQ
jgi:hypothetical protein